MRIEAAPDAPGPAADSAPGSGPATASGIVDAAAAGVTPAVELAGIRRSFGTTVALDDLSVVVPPGTVTVLLGPNGAGKTTAVRVITGALVPERGTVRVLGLDPAVDGTELRRRCGVVPARPALYERLTGWDNLQYAAELFDVARRQIGPRIEEASARFGIRDALDQRVGGYSTGMRARLALARAVLHDPDLLLLDEPTAGLDPESARAVLHLIDEMAAQGRTVVMCTHLLLEAEGLADQVVVMDRGTVLVHGTPDELTTRFWPATTVVLDAEDRDQLDEVAHLPFVSSYARNGTAMVELAAPSHVPELVDALVARGVRLTRVEPRRPSLEELYFAVRGTTRGPGR
ncbi:MAG: ABC transporter ATP-binding protein [Acidimicrobiia bacterium]